MNQAELVVNYARPFDAAARGPDAEYSWDNAAAMRAPFPRCGGKIERYDVHRLFSNFP
jgi:hypothetical protein